MSEDGDNAVMEMDVSFVAADDMRVELIAKLKRASVGLGLAGKLYGNNLRIEGKLRLGCKFVPYYPYLGQLTVAFVTVPILGLSVRPLSSSSVDVTDLPGIASWVVCQPLLSFPPPPTHTHLSSPFCSLNFLAKAGSLWPGGLAVVYLIAATTFLLFLVAGRRIQQADNWY